MTYFIAEVGSITTATRLYKKLESLGCVNASVIHTPSAVHSGGCSYSIRMTKDCLDAFNMLVKEGIKIRGIYSEQTENGEKTYNDIS